VAGERKRLIAFLAVIAALLALTAAWRWPLLQDWFSPQRVAEFMTRFSSPGGRALVAVAGVGLASVLASPPGLSLSVPSPSPDGWASSIPRSGCDHALLGQPLGGG
jgi:hypothetical protein